MAGPDVLWLLESGGGVCGVGGSSGEGLGVLGWWWVWCGVLIMGGAWLSGAEQGEIWWIKMERKREHKEKKASLGSMKERSAVEE